MSVRVPNSTYRVQLTPDFGFADLAKAAAYLERLGVTHAYLSPILQAVPGSNHGYDVINHSLVSTELGGEEALSKAAADLAARNIGVVVDVVPNHVAMPTPERLNPALWSVLLDGKHSPYAKWFDVDDAGGQSILLPILGSRIDEVIDAGELIVDRGAGPDGESILRYYEHEIPIRRGTEDLPIEEMLQRAHYRIAYWHIAGEELNYRRFFDVDTLVAIRVEDPEVFIETHAVLLRLVDEGVIDALRIDHPDGLADPEEYLQRLATRAPESWIVVEKILGPGEKLPLDWQCSGTTGYDAIAMITPFFVHPAGAVVMRSAFAEITGEFADWDETAHAAKQEVLSTILLSELDRLASIARAACQADVRLRDYSLRGLTEGLNEFLANMTVYRAYVRPGQPISAESRTQIDRAAAAAQESIPHRSAEINLLRAMALGDLGRSSLLDEFVVRFQQTSGPVLAKGVEDTATYRWFPIASLCEVGTEPNKEGVETDEFHHWCADRQREQPATMNALSTHDTKRSEDVRARISVVSEIPDKWMDWIQDWQYLAAPFQPYEGVRDARTEWLLWQTMIGAWPISRERMGDYLTKAVREAKVFTSWVANDEAYESALNDYLDAVYDNATLMESFRLAVEYLRPGFVANCLGQKALQLLIPGVPDTYQGSETVCLRLVDPDNRKPVDVGGLDETLARSRNPAIDPFTDLEAAKMRLTSQGIQLRNRHKSAVGPSGSYLPIDVEGSATDNVVGFTRGEQVACVVTRFWMQLEPEVLNSTSVALPSGTWHNVLTDESFSILEEPIAVAKIIGQWPVALLEKVDGSGV